MRRESAGFLARTLIAVIAIAWALSIGLAAVPARAPQAPGYVGDDTCTTCHESQGKSLRLTLHGNAHNTRTPAAQTGQSCETCHGPGQAHVDANGDKTKIKRFTAMSSKDVNATCVTCHTSGSHAQWNGSAHNARDLSCITCHSVHSAKSDHAQLKTASAMETCVTCHRQEATKMLKAGHMPVREGKMDCMSCHNPHGSTNVRMLKTGNSIPESCVTCHTEKRGPYLWQHAPVTQNCATCHDPHGSNNDSMLVAKAPMICQRCHISTRHPPTIYDGSQLAAKSNRLVGGSCINCHSQIHGSNSPAGNRLLR
jgi:DmsE family decaheme c-type cytochrome